ncbi:MAG: peptide-N-glycosidase F-related protein [Candidatus Krumholzibacteriia bacterium]
MRRFILLAALLILTLAATAQADPAWPDTTWVRAFDQEFINWATPHEASFAFPGNPEIYSQVLLTITIGCPGLPGDCDPWDRYAWLRLVHDLGGGATEDIEIARFITPYDITGPPTYPGSCAWTYDVTDYKFLLKDLVTLKLYIESWMGNDRGWLITCDFAFVHGVSALQPYQVVNLYLDDWIIYGDTLLDHEEELPPVVVDIPADAAAGKVRMTTTGHGFGFAENCAEFCPKDHTIVVDGMSYTHLLWQGCATNTCSPQGGTWQYPRSGWCPGDKVTPWDNDISSLLVPGGQMTFDYDIEQYFNPCNPTNPDCVPGQTCTDCNYDGTTPPNWKVMGQLILYRADPTAAPDAVEAARLELGQNHPNPFNPSTVFNYTLAEPGTVTLRIYSPGGRLLIEQTREHAASGTFNFRWDGRDAQGLRQASGVYFYEVEMGAERQSRKMLLLQ